MTAPAQDPSLTELLASGKAGARRWRWPLLAGAALLAVAAYLLWRPAEDSALPRFQTESASQGDLTVTVSASGTLAPTNEVEVGSELSGIIDKVLVDVNDRVRKGQVLARLDVSKLQDAVVRSQANLAASEAKVEQASATLAEARANLARLQKVAELSGGKVPSRAELDAALASVNRAVGSQAAARASVAQNAATLKSDRTNVAKASILSPINGVVLARKVEPGQTVAASFSAPILFKLAEDLTRMELQVKVDEADVGQVKEGLAATFTVDAWPGRKYDARITRVNYGSTTTDQVVSYETMLQVDNADLSLRPGMTASAEIVTARVEDAMLVPNAALRFSPPAADAPKPSRGLMSAMMPRPPAPPPKKSHPEKRSGGERVWILQNGQPTPVDITIGLSDGRRTQVTGGALQAGMAVITDTLEAAR